MARLVATASALGHDHRGIAVMEYGMIITSVGAVIIGLMTLGGSLNDCFRTVGSLLAMATGHS